jgi:hypothetical protein
VAAPRVLPDRISRQRTTLWLAAAFALSRWLYFALGVRFNDYPLRVYWQFLAPRLLRARLLESVFYLHSQPPLYNLFLGVVLKLWGERAPAAFQLIQMLCGLGVLLGSFRLLERLGVRRPLAAILPLWLVTSPAFVAYENWLFYSLPLAFLLVVSALVLSWFLKSGNFGAGLAFFGCLSAIGASRSLFHLAWFATLAIGLAALRPMLRRTILQTAAIPLLLLLSLYVKNQLVFGKFTLSTWVGMNLARLSVEELDPDTRAAQIAAGTLSEVSRVPAFGRAWQYPSGYFEVPAQFESIPALARLDKFSEAPNYNHVGYIAISDRYLKDAWSVLRQHPGVYLASVAKAWEIYFRSCSSLKFLGVENRKVLASAFDAYDYACFGRVPWNGFPRTEEGAADFSGVRYLLLWLGLPLVFGFGVAVALGHAGRWLDADGRVLSAFLCLNIAWVACVGNLLELGENNRFRFETDPLSLILLGLVIESAARRFFTRGPAVLPAGGAGSATARA